MADLLPFATIGAPQECEPNVSGVFEFDARASAVDTIHSKTAIYTSAHVVDALLERVNWPEGDTRLLDPSCGDGAFLLSALEKLCLMPDDTESALRVRGCEIHPGAVNDCRERVEAFLLSRGFRPEKASELVRQMIREGDFLTDEVFPGETFHCIVGNPPYLRYGHLPDFFKALYAMSVEEYARGDLLHMFLVRCCSIMPLDGAIALVTSDRWVGNTSTAKLRQRIGQLVGLDHIERIDCDTSFYRPKKRVKGSLPRIHPIAVVMRTRTRAKWAITDAAISPDVAISPYTGRTLTDIAEVRIAPWLGPVGAFVVDASRAAALHGADLVPAVDTDDIDPKTNTLREPRRWAIRTSKDVEPTGALGAHLKSWAPRMPKRSATRPYWLPPESITLPLDKPALLIPRISRTLRAINLPAGMLPVNHNLSVVSASEEYSLDDLKEIITSEQSQQWFRQNAQRLENGYFSVITSLLRRLPVD